MSDLINPQPNLRVLEVGTGSGCQATVLSLLKEGSTGGVSQRRVLPVRFAPLVDEP